MKALNSLRIFVQAVKKGSLAAAGKGMGLSVATLSRRISALEEELGVQLLDRASRQIKPTEAGLAFLHHADALLQAAEQAEEAARTLRQRPEGKLRVHARSMIGTRLIAPRLQAFCKRYPDISIELMLSDESINIAEHDFDVDIRTGRFNDSSFALRRLTTLEDVLVASPTYLREHPPITCVQDLLQHNCMTYRKSEAPARWQYQDEDGVHDIVVEGQLHSNSGEVLRQSAIAGAGLALLAEPTVRDALAQGQLVPVLPHIRMANATFGNGVFAVFRAGPMQPLKLRLFIDHLSESFAQETPAGKGVELRAG